MLTIREFCEQTGIPRARVKYWLHRHLESSGLARKTGLHRRAIWLIDPAAETFLNADHKPGPRPVEIDSDEKALWEQVYRNKRSVNGVATHFVVSWQTAARKLDRFGIREYRHKETQ